MPRNEVTQASDVGPLELNEEIIRQRAYQLFEERGCESGHELDDWLQAEAEVLAQAEMMTKKAARALKLR